MQLYDLPVYRDIKFVGSIPKAGATTVIKPVHNQPLHLFRIETVKFYRHAGCIADHGIRSQCAQVLRSPNGTVRIPVTTQNSRNSNSFAVSWMPISIWFSVVLIQALIKEVKLPAPIFLSKFIILWWQGNFQSVTGQIQDQSIPATRIGKAGVIAGGE